ncbi:hypothetical protein Pla123a_29840 [Posidoniimonas polymericola]|uniref:Cell division protein FtsQ n=1 Tax=Posidoniimonas polymericola TaxID=2528002 RepID=A0A5C5YKM7_9BACT|nr:hypothetical protein [Posidoniimonas polymericola]TWT75475.1 hypothetical protein Pla123a_29840 [Posidoniimonas polymericola]
MAEPNSGNLISAIVTSVAARRRVLLGGAVLVGLGWVGSTAWRVSQGPLRNSPHYQISVESVQISPPPPWVRVDIRSTAIDRAAMQGPLSVIDPEQSIARIAQAFRGEPWVRKVNRVELQAPNGARVDLQWRQPLAVVELATDAGLVLTPLDAESVRLPSAGLHDGELRRLPRITHIQDAPPEGEAWANPQVNGAVALISSLGPAWTRLSLADVVPSRMPEIRGDQQFYQYELLTIGGTRIYWGAAPGVPADEPAFNAKLTTLQQFVQREQVRLDSDYSPKTIDLRHGFDTTKRIAKKNDGKRTAQAPDDPDSEVVK